MSSKAKSTTGNRQLCARIRRARLDTFGPRGRSVFARTLGVHPSTYRAYETQRTPPPPVLVRISRVSGVDLRALLTGQFPTATASGDAVPIRPDHLDIIERFAAGPVAREDAPRALTALIDLLDEATVVEDRAREAVPRSAGRSTPDPTMIPVLGRTAAGVPHFYAPADSLPDLLSRLPRPGSTASRDPAVIEAENGADVLPGGSLVRVSKPVRFGDISVSEFVAARRVLSRHPNAFALRIDGESMSPRIRHGDLVIVSPDNPAEPGRPAVVKLRGRVGVICKLFVPRGLRVRLIPINNAFPTTSHRRDELVRALAVLYVVRAVNSPVLT